MTDISATDNPGKFWDCRMKVSARDTDFTYRQTFSGVLRFYYFLHQTRKPDTVH
jgi:hypothetical protein